MILSHARDILSAMNDKEELREELPLFCRNVKRLMDKKGLTQADLARKLGIGDNYISEIVLGLRGINPGKETCEKFGAVLEVKWNEMLEEHDG